jgi:hypothetical protein
MEKLDPFPPADPLAEALQFLRMNGAFYCRSELSAPWGLTLPAMPGYIWFHVVTSGRLWLEADDAEGRLLQQGDLALVPHGEGHCLRSDRGVAAPGILDLERELVSDRYEILRHGGGGAPTGLICGAVRFDHPAARNLVEILPTSIYLQAAETPPMNWIQSTLSLMAAEAKELRPGSEAVITRLGDILVIQAIRSWIEIDPAAQTRSAFAGRFTELVGEPAMQYVARWRMQLAVSMLEDEEVTVGQLADRLGYRSEAAFSRAFKRIIGVSPGRLSFR